MIHRLITLWCRFGDRSLDRPFVFEPALRQDRGAWNAWVGELGERLAACHLRRCGKKVLYRNFRAPRGGEIDIIFRDGETLVFGEVKTRTSEDFGRPAAAVDAEKQGLIIRGANAWLRELNLPEVLFRFDVIEVTLLEKELPKIHVVEGAFVSNLVGHGM